MNEFLISCSEALDTSLILGTQKVLISKKSTFYHIFVAQTVIIDS